MLFTRATEEFEWRLKWINWIDSIRQNQTTYIGENSVRYVTLRIAVLAFHLAARLGHLEKAGLKLFALLPALVGFARFEWRNGHAAAIEGSLQQMPRVLNFGVIVVAFDRAVHLGAHSFVHFRSKNVGQNDGRDDQTEDDEDDREVDYK